MEPLNIERAVWIRFNAALKVSVLSLPKILLAM
jgi:hypothetical protein